MIIRSQNKEVVLNFNQVVCFRVGKRINKECDVVALYSPFSENDCGFVSLGEYSSKEKAIKVLDMIQDKYCMMNASNCMMTGTMRSLLEVTKEIQDKTVKAHRDLYVFEMPADKEVEV